MASNDIVMAFSRLSLSLRNNRTTSSGSPPAEEESSAWPELHQQSRRLLDRDGMTVRKFCQAVGVTYSPLVIRMLSPSGLNLSPSGKEDTCGHDLVKRLGQFFQLSASEREAALQKAVDDPIWAARSFLVKKKASAADLKLEFRLSERDERGVYVLTIVHFQPLSSKEKEFVEGIIQGIGLPPDKLDVKFASATLLSIARNGIGIIAGNERRTLTVAHLGLADLSRDPLLFGVTAAHVAFGADYSTNPVDSSVLVRLSASGAKLGHAMRITIGDGDEGELDAAIVFLDNMCPVLANCIDSRKRRTNRICTVDLRAASSFFQQDQFQGVTVFKKGSRTGVTEGRITSTQGHLFIVEPEGFAKEGDSGGPVYVDWHDRQIVLGIISRRMRVDGRLVIECVRMDWILLNVACD
eukprot:m.12520 g.12520  ORF g.12520 m.12520 type:complete len:410 (-) comp6388_c0_seq1:70-1299(-)